MTTKTATIDPIVRTLYFDQKDSRWVYIVWDTEALEGVTTKIPRTVHTKKEAEAWIKSNEAD
jgi:hypothetical protein